MLFFPLVCVCFAYGSIYFVVRKSVQEIDSHHVRMSVPRESFVQTQNTVSSLERNTLERPNQNKVSVVASVRPSGARRRAREVDETQALLVQSIVLVVVFVVGWTPFMCKALYEMATSERVSPEVDYWTDFVVVLMHLCNPILVLVYNLEMRQNVVLAFYYFHKST
ncbi:hypothetical protein BC830DRAFT_626516 [Chytriomyces sp. MP71]|nr:hypothetical protein BC830DRAFT_626516 [Chytriomyces sp. MP71]